MPPKKRYQRPKGQNPALADKLFEQKIISSLNDARRKGIDWACLAYEVMTLMVLHDKFGITDKDELRRYCKEMGSLSESMEKEYANLSDFIKTLKEESGFTLSDEDIAKIDPGLAGYMASEE